MTTKVLFFASIIFSLLFSSCIFSPTINGNGKVVRQERKLSDFDELEVSRGMNVYLTQGTHFAVTVEADENLLSVIETEVDGDVLKVSSNANIKKAKSKKVYITLPQLERLEAFAGSNIYSEKFDINKLELSASAGSNLKLNTHAVQLELSASAGSNIKLEGRCEKFSAKVSSGSNIRANELSAKSSELKVSSGANIWISVEEELNASASSGGNIFYYGNPDNTEINRSSGGNVIKK